MAEPRERRHSNSQLLQELDALSQTLYQSNTSRRTASLALPRSAIPPVDAIPAATVPDLPPLVSGNRPRARRMSMSPFRSRPKSHHELDDDEDDHRSSLTGSNTQFHFAAADAAADAGEKKGIWGWKPIRALAHIRMKRIGCLFSTEVVAIQGLPASMNGLRLSVAVRKKESKGAVQTMPARVLQGSADFEETLFIRCHVYCSGKPPKFEAHPFLISAVAIDAPELDFGKCSVDLSLMVKESMERNMEGSRIRQWDAAFPLSGKAKGGELVVKLGFQIMEDGGVEIFKQAEAIKSSSSSSSLLARRQSKSSFSVSSPKITRLESPTTSSRLMASADFKGIDEFTLDDPNPPPPPPPPPTNNVPVQTFELEEKQDDHDLPKFEVIDKGVEVQEEEKEEEEQAEPVSAIDEVSVSTEVVKEVVHHSAHLTRLTELDAIARQIKALESMVAGDETTNQRENENQRLDADEETVTREFLHMLELEDGARESMQTELAIPIKVGSAEEMANRDARCFLSDLGKGLGSIVQTRDGGYLASTNPFDTEVSRKETPKLAIQTSKPIILKDFGSGIELFQRLAAVGSDELASRLSSLASMDELIGKTAEQIAFEGIASAIISGRNKEGASSSAAKSVAALKSMATYMTEGRKERILTGIWNVKEEPVTLDEILPFSLQKIESMAVEALKIQADMAEEEAPFNISPLVVEKEKSPLESPILPEDWATSYGSETAVTMMVVIQTRDPLRRYDAVGAPAVALIQATRAEDDEEAKFKVTSLHVGGMKMKSGARRSGWDGEKQGLTAMQWLVAYGLGKVGKKRSKSGVKGKGEDFVWSISSRVMADMWMKPTRNPDVKFSEK